MKDSFVFYRGFRDAIDALPEEYQLKVFQYLMAYAFDGVEPEENGIEKALFLSFKPQIDAAQKRYEANIKNGRNGGRPKKETQENPSQTENNPSQTENNPDQTENNPDQTENNPDPQNKNPKKPSHNLNDNINVNDNDNVNDNINSPKGEVQEGENLPPNPPGKEKTKQQICKEILNSFVFSPPLQEKVEEWLAYKKERRESYQPTGLQRLLTQIKNKCSIFGECSVMEVIDISISNNYQGILWDKIAKEKKEPDKNTLNSFAFPSGLRAKVEEWLHYKTEQGKPYHDTALKNFLEQVQKEYTRHGEQAVINIIQASMASNYDGVMWQKIVEKNGQAGFSTPKQNRFVNYEQRKWDFSSIEQMERERLQQQHSQR